MSNQPAQNNESRIAIQPAQQQSKLLEIMAQQYGLDAGAFKSVLLKTVFPQDKTVTMEQLASFCSVANEYKLNPLIREIFAFPGKAGGIIPIVSIDGWITMVQRHPQYNGHSFLHEWENGKVGGKLVSMTCVIRRKDREFPIENTEFMEECKRDTEPWKKWPSRMLRHKCFIQGARYAFGLSGVYDEDEAERILEGEVHAGSDGVMRAEIKMPQRQQALSAGVVTLDVPQSVVITNAIEPATVTVTNTVPVQEIASEEHQSTPSIDDILQSEPASAIPEGEDLFGAADRKPEPEPDPNIRTIGKGKAGRLRAIANSKKTRSEEDFDELKRTFKIEHLHQLPEERYKDVEKWVEGK